MRQNEQAQRKKIHCWWCCFDVPWYIVEFVCVYINSRDFTLWMWITLSPLYSSIGEQYKLTQSHTHTYMRMHTAFSLTGHLAFAARKHLLDFMSLLFFLIVQFLQFEIYLHSFYSWCKSERVFKLLARLLCILFFWASIQFWME